MNIQSINLRFHDLASSLNLRSFAPDTWIDAKSISFYRLEAPILLQPDTDFQSLDGLALPPQSWSETPLSKIDGVPVECAVSNASEFP